MACNYYNFYRDCNGQGLAKGVGCQMQKQFNIYWSISRMRDTSSLNLREMHLVPESQPTLALSVADIKNVLPSMCGKKASYRGILGSTHYRKWMIEEQDNACSFSSGKWLDTVWCWKGGKQSNSIKSISQKQIQDRLLQEFLPWHLEFLQRILIFKLKGCSLRYLYFSKTCT